ncbi:fasciclin domain-containing protein [Pinibacter soli]|uniref:Fasciclin domain-containing protein n=1 Tax=Pinibacter soli TaxID=3044211 RepID=A0ABT6RJH7_9BACT|nr:fasciclin domain-containing protein [Pinibacter soli]MDI3322718.1 fasciclin domain-containing protein [Pinibacter soli]
MRISKIIGIVTLGCLLLTACKKNDYYVDSGTSNPKFNGTVMDYLQSKTGVFDTTVQVIKLAGMEKVFSTDTITFFAPNNICIRNLVTNYNFYLSSLGRDTVKKLSDIDPSVWKNLMSLYVFKGARKLTDFHQLDLDVINSFSGGMYVSYNGRPMNIGVRYNDEGSIKYAGYRSLYISYILDLTRPTYLVGTTWTSNGTWIMARVTSSDIQPTNGVVHVIAFSNPPHSLGFDFNYFLSLVN